MIEVRLSYFLPQSSDLREIYHGGGIDYQLTGTIPLYRGEDEIRRGINFWWAADYFQREGHSIGLNSGTRIRMEPVTGGLKYIQPHGRLRPYFGAGLKYYFLQIHNDNPFTQQHVSRNGAGAVVETGLVAFFLEHGTIDIFLSYSFMKFGAQPIHLANVEGTSLQAGGLNAGAGMGVRF